MTAKIENPTFANPQDYANRHDPVGPGVAIANNRLTRDTNERVEFSGGRPFDSIRLRNVTLPITKFIPSKRTPTGIVTHFDVEGQEMAIEPRFWQSLYSRYGFSNRIFAYFDHGEVFSRIQERGKDSQIKVTIDETEGDDKPTLLSVTGEDKDLPRVSELGQVLRNHGIDINSFESMVVSSAEAVPAVSYQKGILRVIANPRNIAPFKLLDSEFAPKFCLDIPMDGYGNPNIYLAMLRMVCTNLAIATVKAYKAGVSLGKTGNYVEAVNRALEGFNDDDGYDLMRNRIKMAAQSHASINEISIAYQTLVRLHNNHEVVDLTGREVKIEVVDNAAGEEEGTDDLVTAGAAMVTSPILAKFRLMMGDLTRHYGLANLDALSTRRKQSLPTEASVYDVMNFMSEVATHNTNVAGQRKVQAYLGGLLATPEFDMEDSKSKYGSIADFLVNSKSTIEAAYAAQNTRRRAEKAGNN